ncbi:hypothetical protein Vafri_21977 [Volvox africanus]|uniref:HNH nuclease domain-containing protein n=1 Tax=Volvox africanus TaxID=51714 RepID=A0A8J4BSS6_9CHLO|nr:hypothetical protein Vafri_21977 [Volvox africanus]
MYGIRHLRLSLCRLVKDIIFVDLYYFDTLTSHVSFEFRCCRCTHRFLRLIMALTDRLAACKRLAELYKDDLRSSLPLMKTLSSLGDDAFLTLHDGWEAYIDSPVEKAFVEMTLSGMSVGPGPSSRMTSEAMLQDIQENVKLTQKEVVLTHEKVDLTHEKVNLTQQQVNLTQQQVNLTQQQVSFLAKLVVDEFTYTTGKISGSHQDQDFKKQLQMYYGHQHGNQQEPSQLSCMLLDVLLPKSLVVGTHIFKRCWRGKMKLILGLPDINDPRNGLLLCKGLQHALDDSRICFAYDNHEGEQKFILELLDRNLQNTTVWEYMQENNLTKYKLEQFGEGERKVALLSTFGQLKGKSLTFSNGKHPFKRCLAFHAKQAVRRAHEEGWLPDNWEPMASLTYASEEAKERLGTWLDMVRDAPAPISESSIKDDED